MIHVAPFVGTSRAGKALDEAMTSETAWRAHFANGEHWTFKATGEDTAHRDAEFWASFTGRVLLSVDVV